MSYRWRPNRDAGSIRSHTHPSTRRVLVHDVIPSRVRRDDRRRVKAALRVYLPELACGDLTLSCPKVRDGWDEGDKFEVTVADYILA
jgi:hypothetical protein